MFPRKHGSGTILRRIKKEFFCTAFKTTNRFIVRVIALRLGMHFASLDTREPVIHCTCYESVNLVIMSKIWC